MEEKYGPGAFSEDGYVRDQDCFADIRYRTMPANINGCGPIAVFNLLHFLGLRPELERVYREMDELHRLHAPGPTSMRVIRLYLGRYVPGLRETTGREEALAAAGQSPGGVFRYREAGVPHYVSFLRQPDGRYRFFNVADGL
ncbi:MAG: hypothetical protein J5927_00185, partial [Oscillospiraceae bacterium]|nr:hypothetical protein [Oscillospiraceae bacterium]